MQRTGVPWTDCTSNPVYVVRLEDGKRGWICHKCSPGCKICFAEALNLRLGTRLTFRAPNDSKVRLVLGRGEFDAWFHLKTPSMIFIEDMGDLFLVLVSDEWLDEIFHAMCRCPWHVFQVLTKRPERMLKYVQSFVERFGPLPENIWLGVSVESWPFKNRIDILRRVPCRVRIISFEPLLASIRPPIDLSGISWAIAGGESGPQFRPMNLDWAREIRDGCARQDVPFFFKQTSGRYPGTDPILDGKMHREFPQWKWKLGNGKVVQVSEASSQESCMMVN